MKDYGVGPESIDVFEADARAGRKMTAAACAANKAAKQRKVLTVDGERVEPSATRARCIDESTMWADNGAQLCGAHCKARGGRCRRPALGNGRCRQHGGCKYPVSMDEQVVNARTGKGPDFSSVYAAWYTDDEVDVYDSLRVGTLEEEIRLVRVQLRRALARQAAWEEASAAAREDLDQDDELGVPEAARKITDHFDVDELSRETKVDSAPDGERKTKIVRRRRDYKKEINYLLNLLAQMEATHANIVRDRVLEGETVERIAEDLRSFTGKAAATTPGFEDLARAEAACGT